MLIRWSYSNSGGFLVKILVIGSGGREHALVWRLTKSPRVEQVIAAPGNPGIAGICVCEPAAANDDYLAIAEKYGVDMKVVGPEVPLVAGVVDVFQSKGKKIVGPTAAAAQLEGSKAFSKNFMVRAEIPTADFTTATGLEEAIAALDRFDFPVVLKADGLAAGKGVVIAQDRAEAESALPALLANSKVVIEEFLRGEEVSFIVLTDGYTALPFEPTQDHKAVFNGDRGPNTGGMGAYCDVAILSAEQRSEIMATIVQPTIDCMRADGILFTGFLYAGLMMTSGGPKVLEFNARLGDPETQALMHRLDSDFAEVLYAAASGQLAGHALRWRAEPSVCVVMAAEGYPGKPRSGDVIHGIAEAERTGASVFHAGTRQGANRVETSGGRVLGVTARGADLRTAIGNAYAAVAKIHFDGMHYRTDIGAKGLIGSPGDRARAGEPLRSRVAGGESHRR
jgi:phosphoribosylamine---glycine ligase